MKGTEREREGNLRLIEVLRVSRRAGREGPSFLAPDQQHDINVAYVSAHGHSIVRTVDETDSVSGSAKNWQNRGDLQDAMDDVLAGRADGIIVAKLDRFSRSMVDGYMAIRKLQEAGKTFIAVAQGIDSWHPRDPNANLLLTIHLGLAQWLWESLAEGWRDVVERHIDAGVAAVVPYGYERCIDKGATRVHPVTGEETSAHKRLVPHPEQAPIVVRIFNERAAGRSWHNIADGLSDDGVPTPSGNGRRWVFTTVAGMVANRTYLGEVRSGELSNPHAHEPLIGADLWHRANERTVTTRRRPEQYLLAGLVRCASCGARMRGATDRRYIDATTGGPQRVYRCEPRRSWGRCPHPTRVKAAELEQLVFDRFHEEFLVGLEIEHHETDAELSAALDVLRDAEAELSAFVNAPSTFRMRDLMGEAAVDAAVNARLDVVEAAKEAVRDLQAGQVGTALPDDIDVLWPEMEQDDRRAWLGLVYPVIAVAPQKAHHPSGLAGASWGEPIAGRVRIWHAFAPDLPTDLPGSRRGDSAIRPLPVTDGPGGPGVAAPQVVGEPPGA